MMTITRCIRCKRTMPMVDLCRLNKRGLPRIYSTCNRCETTLRGEPVQASADVRLAMELEALRLRRRRKNPSSNQLPKKCHRCKYTKVTQAFRRPDPRTGESRIYGHCNRCQTLEDKRQAAIRSGHRGDTPRRPRPPLPAQHPREEMLGQDPRYLVALRRPMEQIAEVFA